MVHSVNSTRRTAILACVSSALHLQGGSNGLRVTRYQAPTARKQVPANLCDLPRDRTFTYAFGHDAADIEGGADFFAGWEATWRKYKNKAKRLRFGTTGTATRSEPTSPELVLKKTLLRYAAYVVVESKATLYKATNLQPETLRENLNFNGKPLFVAYDIAAEERAAELYNQKAEANLKPAVSGNVTKPELQPVKWQVRNLKLEAKKALKLFELSKENFKVLKLAVLADYDNQLRNWSTPLWEGADILSYPEDWAFIGSPGVPKQGNQEGNKWHFLKLIQVVMGFDIKDGLQQRDRIKKIFQGSEHEKVVAENVDNWLKIESMANAYFEPIKGRLPIAACNDVAFRYLLEVLAKVGFDGYIAGKLPQMGAQNAVYQSEIALVSSVDGLGVSKIDFETQVDVC